MNEPIRLRPFREHLEREPNVPMLEVVGRIEGRRFVVSAIGRRSGLETVEIGEGGRGAYALVSAGVHTLPNGFKVRVEMEPNEYLPRGGVIDVILEGVVRDEARERLRAEGIAADSVVLVAHYERFFSISFNSLGFVNGRASSYVADGEKTALN